MSNFKKRFGEIPQAPTPQNTPSSVTGSYLKNNAPMIPSTIDEEGNEELRKKLLNNPVLLSMIQGKLDTLIGKDSGYVDRLPKAVKNKVFGLKSVQQKQFKLEAQFQSDLLELERKYELKYKPLYEQRKKIITGALEPTQDEIEEGQALFEEGNEEEDGEDKITELKEEDEEEEEEEDDEEVEGIPSFWLTALENVGPVADTITERDTEVLSSLIDIKMEHLSTPGFNLIFEFAKNDFFANKTLTKTYYYQKELSYSGDFIYDHAEGTNIKWLNNEQNVTITVEKRRQRNKNTKQVRTVEKITPIDSFFNFFSPPKPPKRAEDDEENDESKEEDEEDDEDEEDEEDEIEARLQLDYQIGELIKDKLIPRAVDWFTGEALQYEFEDEDDFEDDDEYDEDEDFDEEDDEEEEGDEDDSEDDSDDDEAADAAAKKTQPAECQNQ